MCSSDLTQWQPPGGCADEAALWNSYVCPSTLWPDAGGQHTTARLTHVELRKAMLPTLVASAAFHSIILMPKGQ